MLLQISLHFVVQDSQKDFQKKKKIFPQDAESWIFISQDFSEFRFSEFALSRSQLNSTQSCYTKTAKINSLTSISCLFAEIFGAIFFFNKSSVNVHVLHVYLLLG